nr:hypothetical protein BdHM001_13270 [Bdellovibrio sp. HM001]
MIFRTRLLAICLLLSFSSAGFAATVSAVKGQKVLINLDGDTTEVGDEFYLINPETQKRTAIIRIKQVKPGKALGDILRGKAVSGSTLQAKAPSSMSADVPASSESSGSTSGNNAGYLRVLKDSWGITGGYLMSTMDADITYRDPGFGTMLKTSASMSGSGFGVGGFYDYVLNSSLVGRGFAAIEQFNVTGSASSAGCQNSTNCDAKINYLSLYGLLKWYPLQDKYRIWVGGGMGYLLALSKSSTALNESQISTNQVFTLGGGVDVQMSRKNYVPVSLEYNMFPPSDTVKASMISIKAGWAWNL